MDRVMRHFIAYVEQEGGIYRRPRLRVKARLAPIRLHGRWVDDERLLAWSQRYLSNFGPDDFEPDEKPMFSAPVLRRPNWTRSRAANARRAVTHHGALWHREQVRRSIYGARI